LALVARRAKNWGFRASIRTNRLRLAGRYDERSGIWGEVKPVYLALQHGKCAYCERQVAGVHECDVEHFRPKGAVERWPPAGGPAYPFATGAGWADGYYLLAYDICNYLVACKTCNTRWKGTYFPIAGRRGPQVDDCRALGHERPYLIYPLGELDADPEALITFVGPLPVPRARSGRAANRARVTIDLLGLGVREELVRERSRLIHALWIALTSLAGTPPPLLRAEAERAVRFLTTPVSPHCSCCRAYVALFRADRAAADAIAVAAGRYLASLGA
jgi:hypothetical protein